MILKDWCHSIPRSGLIGTQPGTRDLVNEDCGKWFKRETNLVTMIDVVKTMKEEFWVKQFANYKGKM